MLFRYAGRTAPLMVPRAPPVQARSFGSFVVTRTKEDAKRMAHESMLRGDDPNAFVKPPEYDDHKKGQGPGWKLLIALSSATFFIGPLWDTSRPTQVRLKVFGTNAPLWANERTQCFGCAIFYIYQTTYFFLFLFLSFLLLHSPQRHRKVKRTFCVTLSKQINFAFL